MNLSFDLFVSHPVSAGRSIARAYFDRVQFVLVKVLVVEIRQPIGFASLLQRSKSNYLNLLDDLQINRIRIIFNFPNNLFNEISFRANLII